MHNFVNKIFCLKKSYNEVLLEENNSLICPLSEILQCMDLITQIDTRLDEENINVNHFYIIGKSVAGLLCCQKWQTVRYSPAG